MISTLKPLKSEEIMETPRRVWKQLLYVKVVGASGKRATVVVGAKNGQLVRLL